MMGRKKQQVALVTGSAGFIGYHISRALLGEEFRVIGIDSFTDYYDIKLKQKRESLLREFNSYHFVQGRIDEPNLLSAIFEKEKPDVVIHLAAQAGVRFSIDNPREYLQSNVVGTFELLEAARAFPPKHMLLASTSSAYGANGEMPYREDMKADFQMSFYAATKKSMENMAHSYAHLFELPTTVFRFFTVYGPWGRPDMAIFKFTKAILSDEPIDIYNRGEMQRDFTFIEDLTSACLRLIEEIPSQNSKVSGRDTLSPVAPFRVVNIGSSSPVILQDFVKAIEVALGKDAKKIFLPMQPGDVEKTWADVSLLKELIGEVPTTGIHEGVKKFTDWYLDHYRF
jgi:UDP-glucuronate 4-epimerase